MADSTPNPKKVLVFGATGTIGKFILQEIHNAQTSFEKIGFFTSAATAKNKADEIQGWKEKGVDVIVGDVTSETDVTKAYEGYDTVVSALGRAAILTQIPLIKIAESSPTITSFYPSEYGTDIEYNTSSATEKPHQLKLQVRKYIRENIKKLYITYLVTGPYSDLYFGSSPVKEGGSFDVKEKRATILGTGNEKVSFTTMKDVGRLLAAALKTPATNQERILKVNSFTVTPKEIVAEFEKQTGAKWAVEYVDLEDLKRREREAWERGEAVATLFTLRRIWTEGGTLYAERDNGKVGFKDEAAETVEEQIRKVIQRAQ